jgi:FKBP-type peptidyl-prolyl cis-trans isomerase 2
MSFNDGDFLEIEYTARNAQDSAVIATTDEKVAKEANIYNKEIKYGPALVVIGANAVVKGLEKELKGMEVGNEKEFTLKPEDAFGNRMEDLVRVMPLSEFRAHNINPEPGMRINIDNVTATVRSVGSGRVVVDANHPDAGKEIRYKVKILKVLQDRKDRIDALCRTYEVKPTKIEQHDKGVDIYFDSKVKKDADYFVNKTSMLAALFTYLKELDRIEVHEEYIKERQIDDIKENKEKAE